MSFCLLNKHERLIATYSFSYDQWKEAFIENKIKERLSSLHITFDIRLLCCFLFVFFFFDFHTTIVIVFSFKVVICSYNKMCILYNVYRSCFHLWIFLIFYSSALYGGWQKAATEFTCWNNDNDEKKRKTKQKKKTRNEIMKSEQIFSK